MASTTYGSPYVQSSDLVSAWPTASLSVADRIDDVSFKGNGLNNQTASYTGVLTDAGKTIMMNVATANTFTIPASGSIAYELGTVLRISNKGAGTTTVQPNGGVTLNGGNISLTQYQSCEVQLIATDIWVPTVKPAVASASGLTLISATSFSAVSTLSVNSCFTATYDAYRILISFTSGATGSGKDLNMRLRLSGTDSTTSYYEAMFATRSSNASLVAVATDNGATWSLVNYEGNNQPYTVAFDIQNPALAVKTKVQGQSSGDSIAVSNLTANYFSLHHGAATAYDGFTIYPSSSTITGTVRIFGYQNS